MLRAGVLRQARHERGRVRCAYLSGSTWGPAGLASGVETGSVGGTVGNGIPGGVGHGAGAGCGAGGTGDGGCGWGGVGGPGGGGPGVGRFGSGGTLTFIVRPSIVKCSFSRLTDKPAGFVPRPGCRVLARPQA